MDHNKAIDLLALLLLYMTSGEEQSIKRPGETYRRAWKGYLFETLNRLAEEKMLIAFGNTKSVVLTEHGIEKAKSLLDEVIRALEMSEEG
jgi:hypothetical protein